MENSNIDETQKKIIEYELALRDINNAQGKLMDGLLNDNLRQADETEIKKH